MNVLTKLCSAVTRARSIAALIGVLLAAALTVPATPVNARGFPMNKPTVLLVHGAFAESSSWDVVTEKLLAKGYPVIAVAIPLRSVKTDAMYLASIAGSIDGPVILVGHSYGGNVISNIPAGKTNVKALVFVSGMAPDVGESAASLAGKFPGSTLGPTLAPPVLLPDGSKDLYIRQYKYHAQFAADVPAAQAKLMATTQRPITEAALNETGGEPAWKWIPSWFLYGSLDKNIPPAAHAFMAERGGSKKTVEVKGASHVVMMAHPDALVGLIDAAAVFATH